MSELVSTSQINKFINNPNNITKELLEGYTMAYRDKVRLLDANTVVRTTEKSKDKVAIITLGGAGHEPALSGFVGKGMLDCSVVGDIFAAPGAPRVLQALKEFNRDAGILLIVLNHAGDVMSANMAMQMAKRFNINVKSMLTHDDVSAGNTTPDEDRRGLAGCVPLFKILGAAAEEGKSLDELFEIGERFNNQIATLAVAMKSCTHPQNGGIIAELPEGIMEIGMGQHGEGGGGRIKLLSADETASRMITQLMEKLAAKTNDKMLLYINGVGATTHMEMNIVFRKACLLLEEKGCQLIEGKITEILTVQEQSGFQMILGKCDEDHVFYLKNCPSDAPYWTVIGKK